MSTRRSRLTIKPNIGPKVGPGAKTTTTGPKPSGRGPTTSIKQKEPSQNNVEKKDKTNLQSEENVAKVESPKKELRKLLMKRVASGDEETDSSVNENTNEGNTESSTEAGKQVESRPSLDHTEQNKIESVKQSADTGSNNKLSSTSEQIQDAGHEITDNPKSTQEKDVPGSLPVHEEVEVNNSRQVSGAHKPNKASVVTRNRLPKAKPNLSDAGRPKK